MTNPSPEPKCGAVIKMGDDQGDNHSTFICELAPGHENDHLESGSLYGTHSYRLSWQGADMREACERCGKLVPEGRMCSFCDKICCSDCTKEDHRWCIDCASQGKTYDERCDEQLRKWKEEEKKSS